MSRRVEKTVVDSGTTTKSLRFVYDGYKMIEELDASNNNSIRKKIVWSGDTPISIYDSTLNATYYYVLDANKNVSELIDASGNVVAHYEYSPFGKITTQTGAYADENPIRFSSEYFDTETSLVYYNYRYYSPDLGRWLSKDPIGERGGFNLYGMVGNNCISDYDLLGLVDWVNNPTKHNTDLGDYGTSATGTNYPGGERWTGAPGDLAVALVDWTIKVNCVCKKEKWVLNYVSVKFTPIVRFRNRASYPSDAAYRFAKQGEEDHIGDFKWWARNEGKPLVEKFEKDHLGDTYDSKEVCESLLKSSVESQLQSSMESMVERTQKSWDRSKKHEFNPPTPEHHAEVHVSKSAP